MYVDVIVRMFSVDVNIPVKYIYSYLEMGVLFMIKT